MENFEGKTAVITGGASGIGLALARRLAAEGANLVLADIEQEALDAAVAELGGDTLGVWTDVADKSQIEALRDASIERFGQVHFLHNNAGVVTTGRVHEQSDEQWEWVLDVNLRSVIWGCRLFLPHMREHGEPAHILNTASMAGLSSGPLMAPYFVTKFGVVALSESMWYEAQADESNVGVSVLCPAFVKTGIAHSDRNQPEGIDGWVAEGSSAGQEFANMLTAGVEAGIEAADVADTIVDGVRNDRLWILTHEESFETVSNRADAIIGPGVPLVSPRHGAVGD